MEKLRLKIPRQAPNPTASAFAHPARIKNWLAALPLGNASKTGQDLLAALQQVNRATLAPNQRYALLEEIQPCLGGVLETLRKQYSHALIPLPEKMVGLADLTRALLTEVAYGYKAVLLALIAAPAPSEPTRDMLIGASYRIVGYLSRLLVESYSVYAPEPKTLWLEVNQLFRYAERNGFHSEIAPVTVSEGTPRSIDAAYRRLLMLALANPYHLMQGEVFQVYQELDKWVASCRLVPLTPGTLPKGRLFIDFESDAPPRYAPVSLDLPPPADGRLLDISAVLVLLEQRTKEVMLSHRTENSQLSFLGRKLRNMYKRLAEAWGIRSERLAERKRRASPVEIAVGISACHHFSGNGADFQPEVSEIDLRQGGNVSGGRGLSLVGANDTPWVSEDQAKRLTAGIIQPRTSQFAADKTLTKDAWVKVYSTQAQHEYQKNEPAHFESTTCRLIDESRGGLAIECGKDQQIRMNVGEVIVFRTDGQRMLGEWSIGTVRWLRITPQNDLDLGVRALADDALAVAVRGIRGAGKGGEYFRALLIPRLDPAQYPTTLITPAGVYDVDSIVLINTGDNLFYAHLTRLMDATNSYSLFQFQIVQPVEEEQERPDKNRWAV